MLIRLITLSTQIRAETELLAAQYFERPLAKCPGAGEPTCSISEHSRAHHRCSHGQPVELSCGFDELCCDKSAEHVGQQAPDQPGNCAQNREFDGEDGGDALSRTA